MGKVPLDDRMAQTRRGNLEQCQRAEKSLLHRNRSSRQFVAIFGGIPHIQPVYIDLICAVPVWMASGYAQPT
jgi:hypothetical protein